MLITLHYCVAAVRQLTKADCFDSWTGLSADSNRLLIRHHHEEIKIDSEYKQLDEIFIRSEAVYGDKIPSTRPLMTQLRRQLPVKRLGQRQTVGWGAGRYRQCRLQLSVKKRRRGRSDVIGEVGLARVRCCRRKCTGGGCIDYRPSEKVW